MLRVVRYQLRGAPVHRLIELDPAHRHRWLAAIAHRRAGAVRPPARPRWSSRCGTRRYSSGAGSVTERAGIGTRNGSSASEVTTHGEMRGRKVLGEERPQRLVLPRLDVARRPVVQQAESEDPRRRLGGGHRRAERVAAAEKDAEFEFVVERPRHARIPAPMQPGGADLAARAPHRRSRHDDRRGAAVISDRHPLVVGQQRIVGPEHRADVGGVIDRRVEVGVIVDLKRHQVFEFSDAVAAPDAALPPTPDRSARR